MFRKPKSKNIRQRSRIGGSGNDLEDDNDIAPSIHPKTETINVDDGEDDEDAGAFRSKNILSFNEDEGDDVVDFKIKRSSRSYQEKEQKQKCRKADSLQFSTKTDRKVEEEEDESAIKTPLPSVKPPFAKPKQSQRKFRVPEKEDDGNADEVTIIAERSDVGQRFPASMTDIPDARAVYEARKKREQLRLGTGNGYIPLDDTVRLRDANSNRSGERSRLVREDDDNDLSDDDDGGKFYSSKSLLLTEEEQRRDEQTQFLRIEQGASNSDEEDGGEAAAHDSDEDELARWEREQINKGVSAQKVSQLQSEIQATTLFYRGYTSSTVPVEQGDADMEVEILETSTVTKSSIVQPDGSLPGGSSLTLSSVLERLRLEITDRREQFITTETELRRVEENISENRLSVGQLLANNPQLQQRYRMFQEIRMFTSDLLECLNEKIDDINALEEQVLGMWKKRAERLARRARQDVQDQYERCAVMAAGRSWTAPSPEFIVREAEREARRSRRRREREKYSVTGYYEGLSSDDEETTSQSVVYSDTMASVRDQAGHVFIDTADEFCSVTTIINRFVNWLASDESSYTEAYVSLCLPKLISPFVRLELLDWNVLQDSAKPLPDHDWYRQLLVVGMEHMGVDAENAELVNIIPSVVEKVILPKITRIVEDQWDPLSLRQSRNLSTALRALVDDYPSVNAKSKRTNDLLRAIYNKAKAAVDDIFVPLYAQEAIQSSETGCGPFLDRQFWRSVKLIRSLCYFRNILSDGCLEELVIEGAVNRGAVVALQFSVLADPATIGKCRALINDIPSTWLPSSRPQSYGPLANVLSMTVDQFLSRDREYCKYAQKFIDAVRRSRL